ncbi:MAG: exo-alpha-sialidase [Pirellulales bacterium]|nr:exo-alpha-sialidase [Pirellulales bacterium]
MKLLSGRRRRRGACNGYFGALLWAIVLVAAGSFRIVNADESPNAAGAPVDQRGLMESEFIFESAPFPSCHASTIAESNGQLIAAWFGGTYERHPDVGIWTARHVDGAWTAPVEVANGVESPTLRYPTWNPVLFQPKNGPLMLFYKVGPSPSEWWGMLQTSDDGGKSWSKARRLPDNVLGPIKNKPIELENGDVLCPSSSEDDGWRVHIERTGDQGKTWTRTPALNDGKTIDAIQPSILVHGKDRLQALGRTRNQRLFEVWSDDGGKTWGEMALTELPNPNSGTDAVTLADGRHLLVYNHNPAEEGRSPLNVAVSTDGRAWEAALELENEPNVQFSYPAVIQTSDGLVHITYTWKRLKIKHAVVDLAKLQLRPIVDGKWPTASDGN